MLYKKGGGNALGVIGIICVILLFDGLMLYFLGSIGQNVPTDSYSYGDSSNAWNPDCDCGTLTCSEYKIFHGLDDKEMIDLCGEYGDSNNFSASIIIGLSEVPIVGVIVGIINIGLIIAAIVLIRGGSG